VSDTPAIELRGVARRFGERTALKEVSVRLPRGATLAVLGRNGAGKSTLLRILATLLRPHGGDVEVLGEPLPSRSFAVRPKIGLLGHEPLLYRDLTGRENLRYHARLHGQPEDRADRLLEAVGMDRRADDPELLLLDEPRANLDPAASDLVEPLIGGGNGCTRVLTSHDPDAAIREANLVLGLRDGEPYFLSKPDELDARRVKELYE
jgi:heme exporter protein A